MRVSPTRSMRNRRGTSLDTLPEVTTLEELLADRIAAHAARLAEERVKAMFPFAEQEPDEAKEVMDSKEAAAFLCLPYSSFREIAPTLPSHAITPQRFGYLRREHLEHFRGRGSDVSALR